MIAQLANYALVIILVASVANLMLHAVSQPLQIAYNEGGSVTGADALRVSVFCGFVLLILTQILPMASGLASGIALSSGNIISGMVRRGLGTSGRFGRGVFDAASGAYSPATASRLDPYPGRPVSSWATRAAARRKRCGGKSVPIGSNGSRCAKFACLPPDSRPVRKAYLGGISPCANSLSPVIAEVGMASSLG